ncbi:MAG: tetratricopeptide repeat protein [Planctomycetaceae bacterium]
MSSDAPAAPVPAPGPASVQPLEPGRDPETAGDFEAYEPLTPELVEEEAIRGDVMLRWAVVLLAFLMASTYIAETAALVHVRTGEYLAGHGWLPPANDVFSYTANDRPWINLSWAFDLLAAGVHAAGGFLGMSLVKALLAGWLFWMIGQISRPGLPTWWGSICGALALLACHERLLFQPTLVTLVGVATVLSIVHSWQHPSADKRRIWLLVPLFIVWGNFDSRAFLGLAALALYAAGDSLGSLLNLQTALTAIDRKQLWRVVVGCVLGLLVHPFLGQSLLAPWHAYGIEYPALREYVSGAYLGTPIVPGGSALIYFPLTTPAFWRNLDLAAVAALAITGLCLVTLLLNVRRLNLGHLFLVAGFLAFALLSQHELAAASLVSGVVATLTGQAWYEANFRQTYSTGAAELAFSRGGRGLTVLAFAAVALFAGTGRLRGATSSRTGFGLDPMLAASLDDLANQLKGDKSFDHRPFNFLLTQGDKLIWIGERVFVDSRVGVYYSLDPARNLLLEHVQTREALQLPRALAPDAATADQRMTQWKLSFGEHDITHIVPNLSAVPPSEYVWLRALIQDETQWQLASLGSSAAVLYRRDLANPALRDFLVEHRPSFAERAFRGEPEMVEPRGDWARPPSFYQRYFWSQRQDVPPQIQEAVHLVRLASLGGLPAEYDGAPVALAHLAIRLAQTGLSVDPSSARGYLALGQAYQALMQFEALGIVPVYEASSITETRYLQAVAAYSQALTADPDNETAHLGLIQLYRGGQRFDLWFRHIEALTALWARDPRIDPQQRQLFDDEAAALRQALARIDEELAQLPSEDARRLERSQVAASRGRVLEALKELDAAASELVDNPVAEQVRVRLLIESGRLEDAGRAAELLAEMSRQSLGLTDWPEIVAVARLCGGEYLRVAEVLQEGVERVDAAALRSAAASLSPLGAGLTFPWGAVQTASIYLYARPQTIARFKLQAALAQLERGALTQAQQLFEEALEADPETRARPLIAYYLRQLTGTDQVDPLFPSQTIPGLIAPEADDLPPEAVE